jgi:hypothetical protein
MSRPLRVRVGDTEFAIHGDAQAAYDSLGPKAKIIGYEPTEIGGPVDTDYDGPTIASIHKESKADATADSSPERANEAPPDGEARPASRRSSS